MPNSVHVLSSSSLGFLLSPFHMLKEGNEQFSLEISHLNPQVHKKYYTYIIFLSFFCGCTIRLTCRILLPWPRIAPTSLAVKTWSPNHWITWEFPGILYILKSLWITNLPIALLLQKYSSPRFQSLALDSYGSFNHTVSLLHLETLPTAPSQK